MREVYSNRRKTQWNFNRRAAQMTSDFPRVREKSVGNKNLAQFARWILNVRHHRTTRQSVGTRSLINGEQVTFHVWEKVKRSEQQPTKEQRERPWTFNRWIYTPTGELTFVLDVPWAARKNWTDRQGKPLEDQLNDVVVGMIRAAEAIAATNRKWEEDRQRALEAERRRQELERQRQLEEKRGKDLETLAGRWMKNRQLTRFLLGCEEFMSKQGLLSPDSTEARWLPWARAYADELNPFTSGHLEAVLAEHRPH